MVFCNELNIDCVVLTETNTNARNGKFVDTKTYGYTSFWSGDNAKIKGSGVAILIADHLQRFISKVHTAVPNYVLHINLLFRGCNLHIIGIYYPPNDKDIQQKIQYYIKHTIHSLKQDILNRVVILGDFNSITNRFLDRTGSSRFYKKPSPVLTTLQQYLYIDTYRFMHPNGKQFTWNSRQSSLPTPIATRIDHIWVSPNWFTDITYCNIEDMDIITGSDHNLATCVLHTGNIIRNHKLSNQKRRDPPRRLYDYKNTTTTHWNLFTDNTRTLFSQDLEFQRALLAPAPSQRSMDVVWSRFQFNTNLAAEILPHKMSTNITLPKPKRLISLKPRGLLKDSNTLRKIIQQVALSNSLFHFNFEVEDWNKQIVDINVRLDLDIPPIIYPPDATWAITANIHLNFIK